MNNELKEFIESKLELSKLPPSKKYDKVQEKIEELKNVTRELESYLSAEIDTLTQPIREIEDKIKMEFPELRLDHSPYPSKDYYYDIYILFKISEIDFYCTLSFLYDDSKYQSGIYSFARERKPAVTESLKPLFDKKIIKDYKDDWYGYEILSNKNDALEHFNGLIKAVKAEKEKWDSQAK